jgi:hypothetical protein
VAELGEPGSYLTLEPGTPVFSSDGEEVGRVERIAEAADADIFDGFVLRPAAPGSDRYVKAEQIDEIFERGVVLALDAEAARALPEPGEGDTPQA